MSKSASTSGSGIEYLRRVTFSCPVCLHSFTVKSWVDDPKDLERLFAACPACGSATLRVSSPDEGDAFFAYRDMRQEIDELIEAQREGMYEYL